MSKDLDIVRGLVAEARPDLLPTFDLNLGAVEARMAEIETEVAATAPPMFDAERKLLERFAVGKPINDPMHIRTIFRLLGVGLEEGPAGGPRVLAVTVSGERYPILSGRWDEAIKLESGTYHAEFLGDWERQEAESKAERRRRKAALVDLRARADMMARGMGQDAAIDTMTKGELLRFIRDPNVNMSKKARGAVYRAIELTPEESQILQRVADLEAEVHTLRQAWPVDRDAVSRLRQEQEAANAARGDLLLELRQRAAQVVGVELPEAAEERRAWEEEHGFLQPRPPTGYKLGVYTCSGCFGAHAVTTHTLIGHHGYDRPGWGYIIGDCPGVGYEPWEVGPGVLPEVLRQRTDQAGWTLQEVREGYTELEIPTDEPELDADGNKQYIDNKVLMKREIIRPGDPRWALWEKRARDAALRFLRRLWRPKFMGIPWIRAALRGWQPSDKRPVGPPLALRVVPEDFADMPPEAT